MTSKTNIHISDTETVEAVSVVIESILQRVISMSQITDSDDCEASHEISAVVTAAAAQAAATAIKICKRSGLSCPLCPSSFASNGYLRLHLADKHPKQVVWNKAFDRDSTPYRIQPDHMVALTVQVYKCYECDLVFSIPQHLISHHQTQHSVDHLLSKSAAKEISPALPTSNLHEDLRCKLCKDPPVYHGSQVELSQHQQSFHGKPLKCSKCSFTFLHKIGLMWHYKRAHRCNAKSDQPAFTQNRSSRVWKRSDGAVYKGTNLPLIDCTECILACAHAEVLSEHQKLFHPSNRWCEYCRQLLANQESLQKHLAKDHPDGLIRIDEFVGKILSCHYCPSRYSNMSGLRQHLRQEHLKMPRKCDLCFETCGSKWIRENHEQEHKGHFSCGKCSQWFSTFRSLKSHLRNNHLQTYQCKLCSESFLTKKEYHRHIPAQHPREKVYFCDKCPGKGYAKESYYRAHLLRHEGAPRFTCDICDKKFYTKICFRNHRSVHIDSKSYLCDICGKAFRSKIVLNRHHKKTHADPDSCHGPPDVPCEICGKQYRADRIQRHYHTHKDPGFSCDICGKLFRTDSNLDQHKRCHSDERPHFCADCGLRFKFPHHLRNHQRRHTGQPNPYKHRRRTKK